jgi:agmatine deiminase
MEHSTVTIGLIQMEIGPYRDENLNKALLKAEAAAQAGARIICLPELFRTRYFPQQIGADTLYSAEMIPGETTEAFAGLARRFGIVIIVPVYERSPDDRYYNTAVIIDADGSLHTPYHKVHIPQDPGFFEKNYFYPGERYAVHTTRYGRIAVLICYDQWFPEAARCVALDGADVIFYPTAIGNPCTNQPPEGDWQEAWELIQRSHAIANSVHVAAVNRVGKEGDIRFFGGSFVCDAFGNVIARAGSSEEIVIARVDTGINHSIRDSWGFFRNRRPDTYAPVCGPPPRTDTTFSDLQHGDTPRNRGFFMPAEWEPHDAVWLSWPHNNRTFPRLKEVEDSYIRFIVAVARSERIELLVPGQKNEWVIREHLRDAGVDLSHVTIRIIPYSDVWIRDYGPTFVVNRALQRLAMVRWQFNAWGGKYADLVSDGKVPGEMNLSLGLPVFQPGIVLEGGSIDTNGRGVVLTTRSCLLNPNRNPDRSQDGIEEILKEYLGAVKVIWLGTGVAGDDTDGHVDDVARFVSASTIVCAYENNPADENYAALQENYGILIHATDQAGDPFTVVKLPMPAPVTSGNERYPASYTNFYIGNSIVVVPIFDDPHDAEAISILQKLFLDQQVVGVNARAMVEGFGTFHCATQQQPRL